MNIYQKLIEVRKTCAYLKKDADGDRFKYVSSSKALGSLRAAMDEHGLLLVPSVIANEVRRHENNIYKKDDIPKKQYFTILEMTFTWINAENPEETIVSHWTGHGLDDAEKGVGKAVTYAEKYFLLKFFNIATDKDDPDSNQGKKEQSGTAAKQTTKTEGKDWYNTFNEDRPTMLAKLDSGEHKNPQEIVDLISVDFRINNKVKAQILALSVPGNGG